MDFSININHRLVSWLREVHQFDSLDQKYCLGSRIVKSETYYSFQVSRSGPSRFAPKGLESECLACLKVGSGFPLLKARPLRVYFRIPCFTTLQALQRCPE